MELSVAIQKVVKKYGVDTLKEQRLLSLLSDYNAFDDMPYAQNMLKQIYQKGYNERILDAYKSKNITRINAVKTSIENSLGCDSKKLTQIFNGFDLAFGIQRKGSEPRTIPTPPPYSNEPPKKSKWLSLLLFIQNYFTSYNGPKGLSWLVVIVKGIVLIVVLYFILCIVALIISLIFMVIMEIIHT